MKDLLSGLLLTESDFDLGLQLLQAEEEVLVASAVLAGGVVDAPATVILVVGSSWHFSTNPSWKLMAHFHEESYVVYRETRVFFRNAKIERQRRIISQMMFLG